MAFSWLCPPPCPTWVLTKEGASNGPPTPGDIVKALAGAVDSSQQGRATLPSGLAPDFPQVSPPQTQGAEQNQFRSVTVFREAEWTKMGKETRRRRVRGPGGAAAAPTDRNTGADRHRTAAGGQEAVSTDSKSLP